MASVQLKVPPVSKTLEDPKPSISPRPGKKLQRLKRLPVKERDDSLASSRMSDSTTSGRAGTTISRQLSTFRSSIASKANATEQSGNVSNQQKKIDKLRRTNATMIAKTRKNDALLLTEQSQRNYLQLERDKVHQFWQLTKGQLLEEKSRNVILQQLIERNKTSHVEEVLDLSQHIRMLLLNARTQKEASNQTDVIFETSQRQSMGCQTVEDMNSEKLREVLQAPERNFARLIAEAESERMKAESDLKFAVVELEQRLKGEHDREMRRYKDQKQAQFDEIIRLHKEEISQMNQNFDHNMSQEREKVTQLQRDVLDLRDDAFAKEQRQQELHFQHSEAIKKAQILEAENEKLTRMLAQLQAEAQVRQKYDNQISNLKKKLQFVEDSNEIILGEFRKLERERNDLYQQLSNSVQMVQDRTTRHNFSLRDQLDQAQQMIGKMRDEQLRI